MCPDEDLDKEYEAEWGYDLQKTKQGSAYLSSSCFLGLNGTEKYKSAMMSERCWYLTTASLLNYAEGDIQRWFPGCRATCVGKISGYQAREPSRNDPNYGEKARKWEFQLDIKEFFVGLVRASRISGKILQWKFCSRFPISKFQFTQVKWDSIKDI